LHSSGESGQHSAQLMTSISQQTQPFVRRDPVGVAIPLVCDSPHSGTDYPADFGHAVPLAQLRQGEDTHVDALWRAAPEVGATLIAARFPRTYIDPNRTLADLDPDMLDGEWPEPLSPGEKTRLGKGLIWSRMDPQTPIYDRRLSVAEVQARIDRYYRPYHDALNQAVRQRYEQFGALWHLNLDRDMLDGEWPEPLSPGEKTRLGKGLIWSRMDPQTPIYDRRLSVAEVQARIDRYYRPYHDALNQAVRQRYEQFGALWHLN